MFTSIKISSQLGYRIFRDLPKVFVVDKFGYIIRRIFRLDDEMPVRQAIDLFPVIEQFLCLFFVAGQGAFLVRKLNVVPAMLERGFEPDACETFILYKLTIRLNDPGAAAK